MCGEKPLTHIQRYILTKIKNKTKHNNKNPTHYWYENNRSNFVICIELVCFMALKLEQNAPKRLFDPPNLRVAWTDTIFLLTLY